MWAAKIPILVSQCEMDHQKPSTLLIFSTLSLGGCGGHPMRPKLNLEDRNQMSTPNEYTDKFNSNLICIFPSVRAKLKKTLCPWTQCIPAHGHFVSVDVSVQGLFDTVTFRHKDFLAMNVLTQGHYGTVAQVPKYPVPKHPWWQKFLEPKCPHAEKSLY